MSDSRPDESLLFISYEEFSAHNGLNTRMKGIARALAAGGRHVEIAAPACDGRATATPVEIDGIRVHTVPLPRLFSRGRIPVLSRALSVLALTVCMVRHFRASPDGFRHVQAEQVYPFMAAYLLARKWNATLILDDPSLLGLFVEEKLRHRWILRPLLKKAVERFETALWKRADCILFLAAHRRQDRRTSQRREGESRPDVQRREPGRVHHGRRLGAGQQAFLQ